MPRGRRPLPDELKALKGNPGKRRLKLSDHAQDRSALPVSRAELKIPEFLTGAREREIFRRAVEDYLQRRIARAQDLTAYARWATYLAMWIESKEKLKGEETYFTSTLKHGQQLRRHPLFRDMLDLERVMQSLEDRLGLNPVARQAIVRGLNAMSMVGPIGEEPAEKNKEPTDIGGG